MADQMFWRSSQGAKIEDDLEISHKIVHLHLIQRPEQDDLKISHKIGDFNLIQRPKQDED